MTALLETFFALPAALLLALAAFFALEVIGAFLPARRPAAGGRPSSLAVVVPAHNEASGIEKTIHNVREQMNPDDRLIVVADNCDDDTAEIAMRAGASCLIRNDSARRGKGYALQFALDKLRDNPPDVVVFLDADCAMRPRALENISAAAAASDRPAQALYLMQAGEGAAPKAAIAEFAWLLMNRVRMSGLSTLFDVTRLTGAGMALPWRLAGDLDLASGEIVEDLALSLRLIEDGRAPLFCPDAVVVSAFPASEEGSVTQRARWEHGSLRLAMREAPALFLAGLSKGDIRLAAAAVDLAVPPLTLFAAALAAALLAGLILLLVGLEAPFELAATALLVFAASLAAAWLAFGREALPPSAFAGAADYLGQKLRVYGEKGRASAASWTRTRRDAENSGGDHDA